MMTFIKIIAIHKFEKFSNGIILAYILIKNEPPFFISKLNGNLFFLNLGFDLPYFFYTEKEINFNIILFFIIF